MGSALPIRQHRSGLPRVFDQRDLLSVSAKLSDENELIADWLVALTNAKKTWGFGLCFLHLRNVKGFGWNHKRVYRIYRQLELNMRIKPRKRLQREKPEPLAVPEAPNEVWSIDFSLPSERVVRTLNQIIAWRGKPLAIRVDNGPEYVSGRLQEWAEKVGIGMIYIQPGKPQQHAYVERYNRTVRTERLGRYHFNSIEEVQDHATRWLWTYNNERPNMGIGGVTPIQKLKAA